MRPQLLLCTLLTPRLALAACPTPTTEAALTAQLDQAERAYGIFDLGQFRTVQAAAMEALPCLNAPLSPVGAARVHRAEGLRAYLDHQSGADRLAFAAARSASPQTAAFPTDVVPADPNYPEWLELGSVDLATGRSEEVPLPPGARLWFDGAGDAMRPQLWPTVFQEEQGGEIVLTAYLWPSDPLPVPPVVCPLCEIPDHGDVVIPTVPPRKALPRLREAALATGGASVATLALGAVLYAGFWDRYAEQCDAGPGDSATRRDCSDAEALQPGYWDEVLAPRQRLSLALIGAGGGGLVGSGVLLMLPGVRW